MRNTAKLAIAACLLASVAVPQAIAADIPVIVPEPVPEPHVAWAGWYLRGDIGFSNQEVNSLHNVLFETTDNLEFLRSEFDAAPFMAVGLGYQFNEWFRVDVTGEYRGKANYHGLDRYETVDDADPTTWDGTNDYNAEKSEWTFLANAYVDLFNWWGVSTYLGAGAGASYNTIHGFTDTNVPNGGEAYAATHSQWQFAWALYAGLAYDVTPNLTVDLGYRYIDLGDAQSGDIIAFDGTNLVDNPMHFRDLTSHDIKLGVRYKFHADEHIPPVVAKY